ncbi:uncharacterized protein LOC128558506 [Mercenaria mercenaria]|uniref:uncharacterized protein LOC128558506 n=1 Tax=Mercenaria mercenaria TaxID=6596 RepID=UPI001E1D4F3F|nr:uncharacterized protein LOC128558506 [Mercenaria mercenaria]
MDTKLKLIIMIVLVSVGVCLAVVMALLLTMPELPTTIGKNQICLPNKDSDPKCGPTADMLHEYLEMIVAKKYGEIKTEKQRIKQQKCQEAKAACAKMTPAVKLTGKPQTSINKYDMGADMVPIREWQHSRDLHRTNEFERYAIQYSDGRLIAPVDGTYFIHSFVELFEPCDPSTGKPNIKDPTKPIKHSIFKLSIHDKEEMELVADVQPHMVSSNKHFNYYSSYVSSLADLKAGDELSVKVSNITYLKYARNNYFGMNFI